VTEKQFILSPILANRSVVTAIPEDSSVSSSYDLNDKSINSSILSNTLINQEFSGDTTITSLDESSKILNLSSNEQSLTQSTLINHLPVNISFSSLNNNSNNIDTTTNNDNHIENDNNNEKNTNRNDTNEHKIISTIDSNHIENNNSNQSNNNNNNNNNSNNNLEVSMDQSFKDFNPPMSSISNNFSFLHSTIDDKVLNNSLSINNNNVIVEDMSMNSEDITNSVLYNNYYSYSSNSNNNNNNNNYNNNKNDFNKHSSVSHPPRDSSLSAIKPRRSYDKNYNKYNYNLSYSSSYGSNDNSYQYNHSPICKSNSYQHNNNMEHDYLKMLNNNYYYNYDYYKIIIIIII